MIKTIDALPEPHQLMNSLRSIGYSFDSALCDVIDNSISARSKNIRVFRSVTQDPQSFFVEILDDGCGMNYSELHQAMIYGSGRDHARTLEDLGRFGLGLKSASLSQCKILTVISKKGDEINAFRWDEDFVKKCGEWKVQVLSEEEYSSLPNFDVLSKQDSGTLVIWTNFDTLQKRGGYKVYKLFISEMEKAERRIRLVYHRFMDTNYPKPSKKIKFYLNNQLLEPFDPFLKEKSKTTKQQEAIIPEMDEFGNSQSILCQPFILPFQKDLSDRDMEKMGGIDEMASMQGFYIYRNYRLISYGSWFGMRPSSELAKYARILIDVPSALDDKWGIDVKKEKAFMPTEVRNGLRKTVEEACQGSHKRVRKRTSIEKDDKNALWTISYDRAQRKIFRVNKESPLISNLKNTLNGNQIDQLDYILDSLSATLSYIDVYSAYAEAQLSDNLDILNKELKASLDQAKKFTDVAISNGVSVEEAIKLTLSTSPFDKVKGLEEELRKEHQHE